jgi:hypothetical protein
MEVGLMKDDTTARGVSTQYADRRRRWWRQLPQQHARSCILVAFVISVVVWLVSCLLAGGILVPRFLRRSRTSECHKYQQQLQCGPVPDDKDSFVFSMAWHYYWPGWYYSYQRISTGATQGPRVLLLMHIGNSANGVIHESKGGYSLELQVEHIPSATVEYGFEVSIGQDANGNVVWGSLDDGADGSIEIDPSVVHLSFSNGATYNVYNDTVFFISYECTGNELKVEEAPLTWQEFRPNAV